MSFPVVLCGKRGGTIAVRRLESPLLARLGYTDGYTDGPSLERKKRYGKRGIMALEQCPDCGGKVSTLAPACPHCGRPLLGPPKSDLARDSVVGVGGAAHRPNTSASTSIGHWTHKYRSRLSGLPRRTWLLGGVAALVLAVVVTVMVWAPDSGYPYDDAVGDCIASSTTQFERWEQTDFADARHREMAQGVTLKLLRYVEDAANEIFLLTGCRSDASARYGRRS